MIHEGRRIGRIRETTERGGFNPGWSWHINPPLPIPLWRTGSAKSLDDAKEDFKEAWSRFYASLTPHDIAHWHHHQDAVDRWREKRA